MNNVLTQVVQHIDNTWDSALIEHALTEALSAVNKIYSYIVYKNNTGYDVKYMISQNKSYNTIGSEDAAEEITELILQDKLDENNKRNIIGYHQPCIDLLIVIFDPLVNKLSSKMYRAWSSKYDFDDLCQICRLVMVTLVNKGYYIHKSLLQKSFENYVLCELRSSKDEPVMVNLEDNAFGTFGEDMDKLTIADIIPDTDDLELECDRLHKEAEAQVFAELKEIIIELIGQRQYDQLLRDYYTGNTTAWSRKTMQKIKNYLRQEGIDKEQFIRKYYGGN